jgi:hypothetical protein
MPQSGISFFVKQVRRTSVAGTAAQETLCGLSLFALKT